MSFVRTVYISPADLEKRKKERAQKAAERKARIMSKLEKKGQSGSSSKQMNKEKKEKEKEKMKRLKISQSLLKKREINIDDEDDEEEIGSGGGGGGGGGGEQVEEKKKQITRQSNVDNANGGGRDDDDIPFLQVIVNRSTKKPKVGYKCVICLSDDISIEEIRMVSPCNHACMCRSCYERGKIKQCPKCRASPITVGRFYID